MNTHSKTSKTVKKLVDEVRPQIKAIEKQYKLTRPQRIAAYETLIELLRKSHNRPNSYYAKLRKMRGKTGLRAHAFLEAIAGVIVDAVMESKAA